MKLYRYFGMISSFQSYGRTARDITIYELHNEDKAPTRLSVYGALGKYIYDIEMTDAEERYLHANWYYDQVLHLWLIEIPSTNPHIPAKIITQDMFHSENLIIFGPETYLKTDQPEPMSQEAINAWYQWKFEHI